MRRRRCMAERRQQWEPGPGGGNPHLDSRAGQRHPGTCTAALRLTHPGRRQRKAFLIQSTLSAAEVAAEVAIFTASLSSEPVPVTRSAESLRAGGSRSEESLATPSGKYQEAAVALGAGGGLAVRCAD
ncbi:hypothetical protein NDU88_004777 [Pleurodeles waltl]|uniref:Uncharacterized protein n=1 Tax=Pleurodeles waltl TaxID=8319 RepID=A0AAV7WW42_PLEWA|nr:hypothetical protein NDU88_004777 [Pleurodeles waltl]